MSYKIALLSDWHWGITTPRSIQKITKKLAAENVDVVINAGDNSGQAIGAPAVDKIFRELRKHMPTTPILSVWGNHDVWADLDPSYARYQANLLSLEALCRKHGVVDLSAVDFWQPSGKTGDLRVFGQMLWYEKPPLSNDINYLPRHSPSGGSIHLEIMAEQDKQLHAKLGRLPEVPCKHQVFVSHFPVLEVSGSYTGDDWWGGNRRIGPILQESYGVTMMLNGHTHTQLNGPVRYESGSDYYKPAYRIIELP